MPEAGWYDDPEIAGQLRYWDGSRWTDQRQPREDTPPPPPVPGSAVDGSGGVAGGSGSMPSSPWDTAAEDSGEPWGAGAGATGAGFGGGGFGGGGFGGGATGAGFGGAPEGGWVASGATLTGAAPPRTFIEAIQVCFSKYFDGKGRASRSEFWYFALFTFILDAVTGGIAVLFLLIPSITVQVRRLHDIGKSAWALLWILVPFVGLIVLIVYAVRPGEPHANLYG